MSSNTAPPNTYIQVSSSPYKMPGYIALKPGEECQIVMIDGDRTKVISNPSYPMAYFSNGPFIDAIYESSGTIKEDEDGHGIQSGIQVKLKRDDSLITQTIIKGFESFYFVVQGGITLDSAAMGRGGSKSRKHLSRKRKGKKSYRKRKYGKSKKSRRFRKIRR